MAERALLLIVYNVKRLRDGCLAPAKQRFWKVRCASFGKKTPAVAVSRRNSIYLSCPARSRRTCGIVQQRQPRRQHSGLVAGGVGCRVPRARPQSGCFCSNLKSSRPGPPLCRAAGLAALAKNNEKFGPCVPWVGSAELAGSPWGTPGAPRGSPVPQGCPGLPGKLSGKLPGAPQDSQGLPGFFQCSQRLRGVQNSQGGGLS